MRPRHELYPLSRREFLRVAAGAGAGAVLLGGCGSDGGNGSPTSTPAGAVIDAPPETTGIRIGRSLAVCSAPFSLAEQFLPAEGFPGVQYVDATANGWQQLGTA